MASPSEINPVKVPEILKDIAMNTDVEAVFKSNCFEFHGLESQVREALRIFMGFEMVQVCPFIILHLALLTSKLIRKKFRHEIKIQLELANDRRDFISGKKNGKLNKISKSTGVRIKFEPFNEYNFLIDVMGNYNTVIQGLTLLQEELPAEISFHVPEFYHKRIIGVGGKNIQRIMKKYGVYVKFSNAEEFAELGGYQENEDNVIARTPAKNAVSLDDLKSAIMELVNPKDKDFIIETISVPRKHHRILMSEKRILLRDIELKTNSQIRFPNKESASDIISIFGPESQVHIASQMLLVSRYFTIRAHLIATIISVLGPI
jgi:hypothetical protein